MAEVRERVEAEMENIERVIAELPGDDSLPNLSSLELAGVAALIQNLYNGIENIIKQLVIARGQRLPDGSSWHRDLLNMATSNDVISESTAKELRRYLAFRHFFSHGYTFDLDKEHIIPLVIGIQGTLASFKNDIDKVLE